MLLMRASFAHAPGLPRVFMNSSSIVAPATPRRTLWAWAALVLALHLWALLALTLPTPRGHAQPATALHTRVLMPAPEPVPTPASPAPNAKAPRITPAPRPTTTRRKPPAHRVQPPSQPAPAGTLSASTPVTPTSEADRAEEAEALADYEHWLADLTPQGETTRHTLATAAAAPPQDTSAPAHEAAPTAPVPAAEPDASTKETAGTQAPALALPPPTQLSFEVTGHVKGFDYSARGSLTWQSDGARYQVRQSIHLLFLGSRAQQSEGHITAQGLVPERFVDEARRSRSAQLDFATHRVKFSDGATPDASIADGAQDRLSVFIQLGARIAAAPDRFPAGTKIRFETVGPRHVDTWTFEVDGPQTLELPAGEVPALKLRRLPREGDDQTDELWLGTALHYLPVRIRLSQGGSDFVDLQLRGHETP